MSSVSRSGSNTHVGLFTNLLWDASLSGSDCAFSDPFEWIRETIEHAREDPGFELLIKTHPAEAMRGTNESICAWIQETWNSLPPNIEVIPPDTDLSPYDVMDNLDVGIVYNSTAGMEMAYAGKPVIVAGYAHYKRYGFTYDIDSPEHYRSIIKSIENLQCDPDMQKIARRYVYYFFYEKHVPFPYSTEMSGEKLFQEIQHTDIGPGNTDFDNLVQSILKNEPVIR
jgi:capsule polysaccharide export protein KpsC/LpsZ